MERTENRVCQNCKKEFTIEPEDFNFYEKIKVPPPTFCPNCREERRLAWLNNFNLYKRPCDLCGKSAISVYAPEAPYKIYCPSCWWSDKWDQHQAALDYDPSRNFLEQFNELLHKAPLLGLSIDIPTSENSPYTSNAGNLKNCYLIYQANHDEDCAYGFYLEHDKSLLDCTLCLQSEFLYDCMHTWKCNNCVGLRSYAVELLDCAFLKDCVNCQDCFMCANLKNKKYCIRNKQLVKEEYLRERAKYDLGSYAGYKKALEEAEAFWATKVPKAEFGDRNVNCRGTHIYDSKNVKDSFQVNEAEDCRYVSMISDGPNTNLYDISCWGDVFSLSYESSVVGTQSSQLKFSSESGINCLDLEYCKMVAVGSAHCFGCAGLKKAKYCVLNKQYLKEEYEKLVAKIKEDMDENPYRDKLGRTYKYGEFFPVELSPHAYNETAAQDFRYLSKNKIESSGYRWRQEEKSEYKTTVAGADLPDHIREVPDSILDAVVGCASCSGGFKIIRMELDFLRHMNLPLPRECPACRVKQKFNLWLKNMERHERTCSNCGAKLITKYTEEEAPRVFCRRCYNAKVA